MKVIGHRHPPALTAHASGEALKAGALFSESLAILSGSTFIPKGLYRFKTHEAANRHQDECLARGMAALFALRRMTPP